MDFDPILPPARVQAMKSQGYWDDLILTDYLERCLAEVPDKTAIVDFNSMTQSENRLSYRDLAARVECIAAGLMRLGVEKNDVVSCQLPNWWQFTALTLACVRIGAVINPMMPIFREREVKFMLSLAESKVFVVPARISRLRLSRHGRGIRAELPKLRHLLVIGGEGEESFEQHLLDASPLAEKSANAQFAARRPTADT